MTYPIVSVKTADDLLLHGLLMETKNHADTIIIHIHGTSGNFYWSSFYYPLAMSALSLNVSYLATNNRGGNIYELEKGFLPHGGALELFEDCLLDIDAWVDFALSKGYKNIILEGHSFGTEKVQYYWNKGKYRDKIKALILLGFNDTVGTQMRYEKTIGKNYAAEAIKSINEGKGETLLTDLYAAYGEIPMSSRTYVNFFSEGSELSQVLPLRNGKNLDKFREISIPILGVIGDNEEGEYTIITIKNAINLMRSENKHAEIYQIKNCPHGFTGKEKELAKIIADFLKRHMLC